MRRGGILPLFIYIYSRNLNINPYQQKSMISLCMQGRPCDKRCAQFINGKLHLNGVYGGAQYHTSSMHLGCILGTSDITGLYPWKDAWTRLAIMGVGSITTQPHTTNSGSSCVPAASVRIDLEVTRVIIKNLAYSEYCSRSPHELLISLEKVVRFPSTSLKKPCPVLPPHIPSQLA